MEDTGVPVEFAVEQRVDNGVNIVKVSGEIDVFSSPRLREMLLDVIDKGPLRLVVDLSDVTFLDSTGLGVLVGIYHRLRARNGSMSFVGANDRVRRVFHITQLTKIFSLYDTLEEALAAERADTRTGS